MDIHDVVWGTTNRDTGLAGDHFGADPLQFDARTSSSEFNPANSGTVDADTMTSTSASGNTPETFGALLRTLRFEAGMTLLDVARAVGVAKPSVWAWENGRAKPTREKWRALAKALGVAPHVLDARVKADFRKKAASAVLRVEDIGRTEMLTEGREMIAKAYGVTPSAVRILVEL